MAVSTNFRDNKAFPIKTLSIYKIHVLGVTRKRNMWLKCVKLIQEVWSVVGIIFNDSGDPRV